MYCHGPPSFKRQDFNCVKLIITVSVNTMYMMCIAMYCHGLPSFQTLDLTVLSASPQCPSTEYVWCVSLCTFMDYFIPETWLWQCQTHYNSVCQLIVHNEHCYVLPRSTFIPNTGLWLCQTHHDSAVFVNVDGVNSMHCQGQPLIQRSDLDCVKLIMTVCQQTWCALYCYEIPVFQKSANS